MSALFSASLGGVSDDLVCLGCGLIVDAADGGGCVCPPPSYAPLSHPPVSCPLPEGSAPASRPASVRGPYRAAPEGTPCPRCGSRLTERSLHDVQELECDECLGLFLDRATLDRLGTPEGKGLRLAFPKRARTDADRTVRYLKCPVCKRLMNRTNFGRMSGVIVDVCKDDGVWFDAGEVNAIIDFVERGGLERARRREEEERAAERAHLEQQRRKEREAFERVGGFRPGWDVRVHYEDNITSSLRALLTR